MQEEIQFPGLFPVKIDRRNHYMYERGNISKGFYAFITSEQYRWSEEEVSGLKPRGLIEHFTKNPDRKEFALIASGRRGMARLQTINTETEDFEYLGGPEEPAFYESSEGFVHKFWVPPRLLPLIPALYYIEGVEGVRKINEKYPDGRVVISRNQTK